MHPLADQGKYMVCREFSCAKRSAIEFSTNHVLALIWQQAWKNRWTNYNSMVFYLKWRERWCIIFVKQGVHRNKRWAVAVCNDTSIWALKEAQLNFLQIMNLYWSASRHGRIDGQITIQWCSIWNEGRGDVLFLWSKGFTETNGEPRLFVMRRQSGHQKKRNWIFYKSCTCIDPPVGMEESMDELQFNGVLSAMKGEVMYYSCEARCSQKQTVSSGR